MTIVNTTYNAPHRLILRGYEYMVGNKAYKRAANAVKADKLASGVVLLKTVAGVSKIVLDGDAVVIDDTLKVFATTRQHLVLAMSLKDVIAALHMTANTSQKGGSLHAYEYRKKVVLALESGIVPKRMYVCTGSALGI